ncbi:MAG: hypothetical protein AB1Z23_02035 [Eubacteriales bacterium]
MKLSKLNFLGILTILCPVWVLVSLQAFVPTSAIYIIKNVVLGCILGYFIYRFILKKYVDDKETNIAKVICLLLPSILMLGHAFPFFKTVLFYNLYLALQLIFVYVAFLSGVEKGMKRTCIYILAAAIALVIWFCIFPASCFTADSYSYYEMSKNIFSDFGKINTHRQYVMPSDYGISFPYLYPAMIAILNFFTGLGIYNGVLINIAAAIGSIYILASFSNKALNNYIAGTVTSLLLVCNPHYLFEVFAARAIPAAIFCSLIVLNLLYNINEVSPKKLFIAGLAAGAAIVIRFDALVIAGCSGIIVFLFSKEKRISNLIYFGLGIMIFAMPWALYSLVHFHKPWISDNGGNLLLVNTQIPHRYLSDNFVSPNLINSPQLWVEALVTRKLKTIIKSLFYSIINSGGFYIFIWFLINAALTKFKGIKKYFTNNKYYFIVSLILIGIFALKTLSYIMVGYGDSRYHVETILFSSFLFIGYISSMQRDESTKIFTTRKILLIILSVLMISHVVLSPLIRLAPIYGNSVCPYDLKKSVYNPIVEQEIVYMPKIVGEISEVVKEEKEEPRVLFLSGNISFIFGAYTGITTFVEPVIYENADEDAIYDFINTIAKPDYILMDREYDYINLAYQLEYIGEANKLTIYKVHDKSAYREEG